MKVMIDIETLSTEHNAVVLSIGAVKFTKEEVTDDSIYMELDHNVQSVCMSRHVKQDTLDWWAVQEGPIPDKGSVIPQDAIEILKDFCRGCEEFWFRGPTFDAVILENLAAQVGRSVPWKFWQIRDARTFDSLGYTRYDKKKVSHNALEDAIEQAKDIVNVFGELQHQLDSMRAMAETRLISQQIRRGEL